MAKTYEIELTITDPHGESSNQTLGIGEYVLGRDVDCGIRFPE